MLMESVYSELLKTKEYGFDFLDKIIQYNVWWINMRKEERSIFEDFLQDYGIRWRMPIRLGNSDGNPRVGIEEGVRRFVKWYGKLVNQQ